MTKRFPLIYSLSTVGIRNHYHTDYLFHPFRTDFTGDSGIGKTMIADMLQLIFVGEREFQSATEANEDREVRKLPLGQFGYVFLNVETAINQYLVFGMSISGGSVDPFIIQQGYDWEEYTPLSEPFSYKKLIVNDNIIDLDQTSEILTEVQCKKLSLKRYHEYLRKYEILPIDLTNEIELKNYAQIIRSFSRGRGFKKNSEWLKKFFFNEGKEDEIYKRFNNHLKDMEADISDHQRNKKELEEVSQKEKYLIELKKLKDEKENAEIEYYKAKIVYHLRNSENFKNFIGEKRSEVEKINLNIALLKVNELNIKQLSIGKEIKSVEDNLKELNVIESNINQANIDIQLYKEKKVEAEKKYPELDKIYIRVLEVDKWIEKYINYAELRNTFELQLKNKTEIEIIKAFENTLNEKKLHNDFLKSHWTVSVDSGDQFFNEEIKKIDEQVQNLEVLEKYTDINNKNSLAGWALNNAPNLTHEQESVLVHLQELPIKKPESLKKGVRFLPYPEKLFSFLKISEEVGNQGFWINLNGIEEFIEKTPVQIFNTSDKGKIIEYFNEYHQKAKQNITLLTSHKKALLILKKVVDQAGRSSIELFNRRKEINEFLPDADLNKTKEEFEDYLATHFYGNEIKGLKEGLKEYEVANIRAEETIANSNRTLEEFAKYLELPNSISSVDINHIRQGYTSLHLLKKQSNDKIEKELQQYKKLLDLLQNKKHSDSLDLKTITLDRIIHIIEKLKAEKKQLKREIRGLQERIKSEETSFVEAITMYDTISKDKSRILLSDYIGLYTQPDTIEFNNCENKKSKYKEKYRFIVEQFVPSESQPIFENSEDFMFLSKEILPDVIAKRIIKEDVSILTEIRKYLDELTEKYTELSERKYNLLKELFIEVRDVCSDYIVQISEIDIFFRGNDKRISQGYNLSIKHSFSDVYPIEWIDSFIQSMDETRKKERMHTDLFSALQSKINPADMMIAAYQKCGGKSRNPEVKELLNPKRYFDISFEMKSEDGELNVGSAGQTYAAVALLCIARLSVIENKRNGKQKNGIRFMPIDEAEGIGSNFDLLERIAKECDYQVIVMSIRPLDGFREGQQYQYILNGHVGKNNRVSTFAIFSEAQGIREY